MYRTTAICVGIFVAICNSENWTVKIKVGTDDEMYLGTIDDVTVDVRGTLGEAIHQIVNDGKKLKKGTQTEFTLNGVTVGDPFKVIIRTHGYDSWHLVDVRLDNGVNTYTFPCNCEVNYFEKTALSLPEWTIELETGTDSGSETSDNIYVKIFGLEGHIGWTPVMNNGSNFQQGKTAQLRIYGTFGDPYGVFVWRYSNDDWKLHRVKVTNGSVTYTAICDCWVYGYDAKYIPFDNNIQNWTIQVETSTDSGAGTSDDVYLEVFGTIGSIGWAQLTSATTSFSAGSIDTVVLQGTIGKPHHIIVIKYGGDDFKLDKVVLSKGPESYTFRCNCWLPETKVLKPDECLTAIPNCAVLPEYCFLCPNCNAGYYGNGTENCTEIETTTTSTSTTEQATTVPVTTTEVVTTAEVATTTVPVTTAEVATTTVPVTTTAVATTETTAVSTENPSYDCCSSSVPIVTNTSHVCSCVCHSNYHYSGCSLDNVNCVIGALRKRLLVNIETLSSYERKKISASDDRTSSQMIGTTGGLILATAAVFVVLSDFIKLLKYLRNIVKRNKKDTFV